MKRTRTLLLTVVSLSSFALAQQDAPSGWHRTNDQPPASTAPQASTGAPQTLGQDPAQPVDRSTDAYGQPAQGQPSAPPQRPAYGLPAQLTLKPGTYVTVRINQGLSTDHNQVGDTFSATLMQPVIVDGVIVANRGQMAYGRVAELQKQHSDNPSRLGLALTSFTLADGTQTPVASQLVAQQGGTTPGSYKPEPSSGPPRSARLWEVLLPVERARPLAPVLEQPPVSSESC